MNNLIISKKEIKKMSKIYIIIKTKSISLFKIMKNN